MAKICFSHHQGDISFWPDVCIPCRFVHSHVQLDKSTYRILYKNIQYDIFVQRSVSEKPDEETP